MQLLVPIYLRKITVSTLDRRCPSTHIDGSIIGWAAGNTTVGFCIMPPFSFSLVAQKLIHNYNFPV